MTWADNAIRNRTLKKGDTGVMTLVAERSTAMDGPSVTPQALTEKAVCGGMVVATKKKSPKELQQQYALMIACSSVQPPSPSFFWSCDGAIVA